MKIVLRLPTEHQYAFVECQLDVGLPGENVPPHKVKALYDTYMSALKGGNTGVDQKTWNKILDALWLNKGFSEEELSQFSDYQLAYYRDFKNTRSRAKENKK